MPNQKNISEPDVSELKDTEDLINQNDSKQKEQIEEESFIRDGEKWVRGKINGVKWEGRLFNQ